MTIAPYTCLVFIHFLTPGSHISFYQEINKLFLSLLLDFGIISGIVISKILVKFSSSTMSLICSKMSLEYLSHSAFVNVQSLVITSIRKWSVFLQSSKTPRCSISWGPFGSVKPTQLTC